MPRFSDIFVYSGVDANETLKRYTECYLIKNVGEFKSGTLVHQVVFDIDGMCLFFHVKNQETKGPFCLTI